ncbi:MAG: right-handed parallel beta-helix repeat-containing protein [Candidatus Acetothermia bacterium]|jgi:parallel beta-helix repeat protein|nr:right-handed parallel beta-helix repeat-containing protein [Candidatus Acetothermia bacterium]MDH7506130.1 right-handed parallel beta-helix repeat-containing protein [Candidatus Acetothermia bacterium]
MRRWALGVGIFALALLVLGTVPAWAQATLYVDDDGVCGENNPCYTTLQAAINDAAAGDTILVYPGTYDPQIEVTPPGWGSHYYAQGIVVWKDNLTIRAVDSDPANTILQSTFPGWMDWWRIQRLTGGVWTASPPNQTGGFNPGTSASPSAVMIVASGVTIEGFKIRRPYDFTPNTYNTAGVMIGGVAPGDSYNLGKNNNIVRNCVFDDVWHAVYIWHSSGNVIENNQVAALTGKTDHWACISVYDGSTPTEVGYPYPSTVNVIRDNTIADKGIYVGAWPSPAAWTDNSGTVIHGNTCTSIGIGYSKSSNVQITNNTVGPGNIWSAGGNAANMLTNLTVSGNTVGIGTDNGMQLAWLSGGTVSSNTVSGRTTNGIALLDSSGVTIDGNTTTGNGGSGIVLVRTGNVTVSGNTINNNTGNDANPGGLTIGEGVNNTTVTGNNIQNNTQFGVWIKNDAGAGNVFHCNNIVGNGVGMQNNLTSVVVNAEHNWWGCTAGPGNTGCDATQGNVDFDPWVRMEVPPGVMCGLNGITDTDNDGLIDTLEMGGDGDQDRSTTTDPLDSDSDNDGLLDGEDGNHNGKVDPGETDPNDPDSNNDGLCDGSASLPTGTACTTISKSGRNGEDLDGDENPKDRGVTETDPTKKDTDGDGIDDFNDPTPLLRGGDGCFGVTAYSIPSRVTSRPTARRAATRTIVVVIINNSGAPLVVPQNAFAPQPDEKFTIVRVSPTLPRTIKNGRRASFSVLTQVAAGQPQVTAFAPYFNIWLACGVVTSASVGPVELEASGPSCRATNCAWRPTARVSPRSSSSSSTSRVERWWTARARGAPWWSPWQRGRWASPWRTGSTSMS